MQFFTPAWHGGDLTDEEANAVPARYASHLDELLPLMPPPVYALARGINIHDGLLRRVRVERATSTVAASLRCGDNRGYFDLELGYMGVQFDRSELQGLEAVARDPESEALYDEIDYDPEGYWLHRILFWPYQEVSIIFQTLRIVIGPTASRAVDRLADPYEDTTETLLPNQPAAADAPRR